MRGHRVRIYPTASQEAFLNLVFGHCRWVYNQLLSESIKEYELQKGLADSIKTRISQVQLVKRVTSLKQSTEWLSEVPMEALQQSARDLGTAFTRFFQGKGKIGYPVFKKKFEKNSFRLHDRYFAIRERKLIISRLSTPIKVRWDDRDLPFKPSNVTISRDRSGRWFASFVTEFHEDRRCGEGQIGIDLGIKALLTTSTGETIENPRHYSKHFKNLQRRHRQHSKRKLGSKNREKSRKRLAKIHVKISDVRRDFLHKLSTRLIDENQVICLETLNVAGMIKNRSLSRHVADVAWGAFTSMLAYKASESGANVILVDRFYPSTQTCSHCDYRLKGEYKLTLKDRYWTCPNCDTTHDRDVNAAVNILKQGLPSAKLPKGLCLLVSGQ